MTRLLFALLRQRFTGILQLDQPGSEAGSAQRRVWIRGGMPVFTDWDSDADRLGELLVSKGSIDAATLERGLRGVANGQGPLGAILLQFGAIDAATRTDALRNQCARKLAHLFALRRAEVKIRAVDHDKGKADELAPINVLALIFRGVTTHLAAAAIEAEMGGGVLAGDLVATPAFPRYQRQFGFVGHDLAVLDLLSRGTTLAGMRAPGVDSLRTLQIVYTLWACQMLRHGQDAAAAISKGATAAASAAESVAGDRATESGKPTKPASKPADSPSKPSKPPPSPTQPPIPTSKPVPEPDKPTPPSVRQDDDFEQRLAALEAKVAAEVNAFELFELPLEAERREVRDRWAELSKTFHPDALEASGRSRLRDRVERVFAALSEAYGVLSDKDQREKLRDAIAAGGSIKANEDATAVVRNVFEAELLARDADKLLAGNLWDRARDLYARAHTLSPNDGDIEAALVYTTHQAGSRKPDETRAALARLAQVIEQSPKCGRAHYFAGLLHLQIDEPDPAKLRFVEALRIDPRNIDAERQLRVLKLRQHGPSSERKKDDKKDDKKGFGLRSLFGKKS